MKSLELFAGIGGIALAAEWAGIETVAFCEKDEFCQKVLNKHWPDVPIIDDIRTLNKQTLEERGVDVGAIELISGGFPCQPYSIAGKREGADDDRDLWPEMFRIIEEIRPSWVVGENVANFANMELDRTLFDLESIGYSGGGRLYYQLAPSGRSIPEKGRSLLPTPIASCGRHLKFTQSQIEKVKIKNQKNGNHFSLSIVELITLNFGKRTNPCFVEMMMGFPKNWTKID